MRNTLAKKLTESIKQRLTRRKLIILTEAIDTEKACTVYRSKYETRKVPRLSELIYIPSGEIMFL